MNTDCCRHYNGVALNKTCNLGIEYESVKVDKDYPCARWPGRPSGPDLHTCALASYFTKEEVDEEDRKAEESIKKYFAAIERNECPHCHQPMTKKQVSRCVYAEPCGHRLYQGTIR